MDKRAVPQLLDPAALKTYPFDHDNKKYAGTLLICFANVVEFDKYEVTAIGGTFDRLHAGHKVIHCAHCLHSYP